VAQLQQKAVPARPRLPGRPALLPTALGSRPANPNLGRPDFKFSYEYPKELDEPFADLESLPHNRLLKPPMLRRRK